MLKDEYKVYEEKMKKSIESVKADFAAVRAGRANAAVLNRISVDYYGTPTPIQQVGSVASPDPRSLVITPWDGSLLRPIEKAILESDLGINPQNDGKCIRLSFPQLTEERRKELVKQIHKYAENGKVAVRNIRRDAMDKFKKMQKASEITEDELKLLQKDGETIRSIEVKVAALEEKFPGCGQTPSGDGMSVPAGDNMMTPPNDGSQQKFPAFEGKDLDGNTVKSDELFSANAVTVVNFWFTTCNPCVGELSELDALNKELAKKGGALIGVNTFTLDGDEAAISEAKDVLAKKGATYQNVYFASDSEAGMFTANIFAYPTTYVVDRNGNIVGDPIVGAITEKKQAETLQKLIDQALAADMG